MKYRTIGSNDAVYVAPNPINPQTTLPSPTPLPAGSSVAVGSIPTDSGRWDIEQFGRFVGTGADLAQKAGIELGPVEGFNWEAAFTKIASFAAAGALFSGPGAPIGAIIGAVVGVIVAIGGVWQQLQNPNWYQVGPGVHEWATANAESAFIGECQRDGVNTWQTVQDIAKHQLTWWLAKYGAVLTDYGRQFYTGRANGIYLTAAGDARALYESAGVDFTATQARRLDKANGSETANVMMYDITVTTLGSSTGMSEAPEMVPATPIAPGAGDQFAQGGESEGASGMGVVAVGLLALVALSSQSKG
jgi:hypothetical protein